MIRMYKNVGNNGDLCNKILEENGGVTADNARVLLRKDTALSDLADPLDFISKNWRDPFTPSIVKLSCEAVEGKTTKTEKVSIALSLMHLTFSIWDDIMDKTTSKSFKPTLFGKYGENMAIIIGGLASAKGFSLLEEMDITRDKQKKILDLVWRLWATMSKAEVNALRLRKKKSYSSVDKMNKIKTEATDTKICLEIGATLGNGSESEIIRLGRYGLFFGIILGLWHDFLVSTNLTLELAEKLRNGRLTYSLLLACERSENFRKKLDTLLFKNEFDAVSLKRVVEDMLSTGILEEIEKNIQVYTKKAKEELEPLKMNRGSRTLQSLVELQPGFFVESISLLQTR